LRSGAVGYSASAWVPVCRKLFYLPEAHTDFLFAVLAKSSALAELR